MVDIIVHCDNSPFSISVNTGCLVVKFEVTVNDTKTAMQSIKQPAKIPLAITKQQTFTLKKLPFLCTCNNAIT